MHTVSDFARVLIAVLYFSTAGQAIAIIIYYQMVRNRLSGHRGGGLLPLHVILVSAALLGFGAEAVVTNYQRVTEPATFWLWYNVVLFALTNYGLSLVLRYERRRFNRLPVSNH